MEKQKASLAATLKHGGKRYLVMDIWEELPRQTDYEKKIIQARHEGVSFCELSELDQRIAIDQIMFRGAASSGCSLPQTEMFAQFIAEEISKLLLNFGFEEYTLQELLLAFLFNSMGDIKNPTGNDLEQVQFHGNCINLVYLAKVFKNYQVLRNNLDAKLKNLIDGHQ